MENISLFVKLIDRFVPECSLPNLYNPISLNIE